MSDTLNSVPKAVEIVEQANCFRGFYRLDKVRLRHELFAGGMGREISRELFVRHDAVCVLPYDPQRDEVVLIEQFRVGALGKVENPWLIEMVAGLIDKDEEPEEVAHREAQEEAGLTFSALWPMTRYFPSPGGSDEYVHLFWGAAPAKAPAGCMVLRKKARTSACASGRSRTPCRLCVTGVSATPRPSSACNGWR